MVGSWIFLVTDIAVIFVLINSKVGISLDNLLSKFTSFRIYITVLSKHFHIQYWVSGSMHLLL